MAKRLQQNVAGFHFLSCAVCPTVSLSLSLSLSLSVPRSVPRAVPLSFLLFIPRSAVPGLHCGSHAFKIQYVNKHAAKWLTAWPKHSAGERGTVSTTRATLQLTLRISCEKAKREIKAKQQQRQRQQQSQRWRRQRWSRRWRWRSLQGPPANRRRWRQNVRRFPADDKAQRSSNSKQ